MFACFIQTAILAVAESLRGVCMNSRFLFFFFSFFFFCKADSQNEFNLNPSFQVEIKGCFQM